MPTPVERSIFQRAALCAALIAVSLITPRFIPNSEGGFGAATSATLVFFAILCVAGITGVMLLVSTLKKYQDISFLARVVGIAPGIIILSALIGLFVFLSY